MRSVPISLKDGGYPSLLCNISDPPKTINVLGKLPDLNEHPPIAIVGSRKPTDYGRENAIQLSSALAKAGFCVISGLAYGIDSIAHKACLDAGGVTVAVLGSGLNNIYPAVHKKLADEIVSKGGAVISEYDDDAPVLPHNFPRRNRIISGMSYGVVVVEAGMASGTLITAHLAAEQGRDVFAVPGPIGNVATAGTHRLIREGAALIESAQDVIDVLISKLPKEWAAKFAGQSFGIGDKERQLLGMLGSEPLSLDHLIERCGGRTGDVLSMISSLECAGLAKEHKGLGYIKITHND